MVRRPRATRDKNGNEIEDFGDIDNLMLAQSVIAISRSFEEAALKLKRLFNHLSPVNLIFFGYPNDINFLPLHFTIAR